MKKVRIVVADDHEVTRLGIKSILAGSKSYEVCAEAADGQVAVELTCQLRPDLLILDAGLPKLNGIDVARRIGNRAPETSVVMLADVESGHLACEALSVGVKGFILKSEGVCNLLSSIDSVLHGMICISQQANHSLPSGVPRQRQVQLLTARQREIVQLLAEGHCASQIAQILSTSTKTVNTHRSHIYRKLQIHNSAELIVFAVRNQIVHIDCLRHEPCVVPQLPNSGRSSSELASQQ